MNITRPGSGDPDTESTSLLKDECSKIQLEDSIEFTPEDEKVEHFGISFEEYFFPSCSNITTFLLFFFVDCFEHSIIFSSYFSHLTILLLTAHFGI